jgi:DNA modification methylase
MTNWEILTGDVRQRLSDIPDGSVRCCVTSPPYWGLRDYGNDGQIGLEQTPEAYVAEMVGVFREVRRVLTDDGTLWLNLGDSYANGSGLLKSKNLVGIPWRVAFALQADGWWLRQDIIWHKPNPMPESVTDRCTKSHEYVFLMTKSGRYFYDADAIKEDSINARPQLQRAIQIARAAGLTDDHFDAIKACGITDVGKAQVTQSGFGANGIDVMRLAAQAKDALGGYYREFLFKDTHNRRSVWKVATKPFKGAHFAVMPEALAEPCVLAGSAPGDLVLDPFTGSGTVAVVSLRNNRRFIGVELNPEYVDIANDRINTATAGMLAS